MTGSFGIRAADPDDFRAVSSLLTASYTQLLAADYESDLMARALPLMTRANPQLLASGTFYVVENRAGDLIGCGGWSKQPPGSGETRQDMAHIRHFATDPDWTRQGVGTLILTRCLQGAKDAAIRILECNSSLGSIEFYRTSGFAIVKAIDMRLMPDISVPGILMRLEFSG